jgi:hypothetical protein
MEFSLFQYYRYSDIKSKEIWNGHLKILRLLFLFNTYHSRFIPEGVAP